ncbi:MAG: heterodisulfide reductase [Myxococcales bacterium]|nr:MAG: heterodisulfide reductase [Myxococcales bacterium]
MMKVSYYPGCSAHGTGVELDESTRDLCRMLDVELVELKDWSCCGASSAHVKSEKLALGLAGLNLAAAEAEGRDLVTPCPACFSRLSSARRHVLDHGAIPGVEQLNGQTPVRHILHLFSRPEVMEKLAERSSGVLRGLKAVCYYGCLFTRPPEITESAHPENPTEMERILSALGMKALDWPYKTVCCGGSLTLPDADQVARLCHPIFDMARRVGAEAIVTGCPMCFMNLERQWAADARDDLLPIYYFTELMMLALDPQRAASYFRRHLSDSTRALASRGLE